MPSSIPVRKSTRGIVLGAAVGLVVVIALFVASAFSYLSWNARADHALRVQRAANEWILALLDVEGDARGYIRAPEIAEFPAPYESALKKERSAGERLRGLVQDNALQTANVTLAERHARAALDRIRELVTMVGEGRQREAAARLNHGETKRDMDTLRDDIDRICRGEELLLVRRRAMARTRAALTFSGGTLLSLASLGLLAAAWRIQRSREELLDRVAREARGQLAGLSDVAMALTEARIRSDVARAIVEHGVRICGADTCTLYSFDDTNDVLELVGHQGVEPEVIDRIRHISESSGNPAIFETLKSGKTFWAESHADYRRLFPMLAELKAEGPRANAFWSVPLIVEGRPVGLLGMGYYEARRFSREERGFIETLSRQCAQALLRAARFEREDEARRWFTTTLRSIGDAVIATDPKGRISFMNRVAENLTGWEEAGARGRHLDDVFRIFSEETGAAAESPVTKVLREGTVVGLANHTVLRSKSGVDIPIDDSGAPIRNESGRLFGVVLVFRDVRHEKARRLQSEFLAAAGEVLASSIDYDETVQAVARVVVPTMADWCVVDIIEPGTKALRQVAVSHVDPEKVRFAKELGERYPPDPKAPRGAFEVVRTGRAELYPEIPDALLEASAVDAEHLRIVRELKLESAMVVPLKTRNRTIGAMTFVYASSGRRYAESDLDFAQDFARRAAMTIENALVIKEAEAGRARERLLRNQAETASRAKDEFLAMVSHELRTPLTAILGWAVTLRGRGPSPDVDRALAVIERNARTQAKLIDDVLDVSRIVSGNLALILGPTNVGQVVRASVETVTPAAEAKEIAISVDVSDESLTITADADRVQQIVWNLLSNAVKFTPKGGKVFVAARREGADIVIRVSDTGEGVRPDLLPIIFEPFKQADASPTRRHGGLGLGLAIVKQLVSAHGGTVDAESEGDNRGSTFTVRLPARSAVSTVKGRAGSPLVAAATARAGTPRLDGLCVVVVDDEADALQLVSEVLRERGAEVHCVASPKEAVDKIASVRPDVIVSDIGMPAMDGYTLMRRIRSLPIELGGRTPAVALTAYARTEDAQRAFAAGYQMHVAKPVEPYQLATVVANLGGRSQDDGPSTPNNAVQ